MKCPNIKSSSSSVNPIFPVSTILEKHHHGENPFTPPTNVTWKLDGIHVPGTVMRDRKQKDVFHLYKDIHNLPMFQNHITKEKKKNLTSNVGWWYLCYSSPTPPKKKQKQKKQERKIKAEIEDIVHTPNR